MASRPKRKRNPVVLIIYMVFVWPAYLARWLFGLFFKIVALLGSIAEGMAKKGIVRGMHEKGGFQGFLAILIDLAMAAFVWLTLLYAYGELSSGNLLEWTS